MTPFSTQGGNMKISINERFKDYLTQPLEALGHEVVIDDESAEMVIAYPTLLPKDITVFKNMKYLQLLSSGYDTIDLDYFKENNIKLMNGRGLYSTPIAEYILGHVLNVYQNIPTYNQSQREKAWVKDLNHTQILGKTVLFLGTGSIASETAKRFKAFGSTNIGFNSNGRSIAQFDFCYPLSDFRNHLKTADIVVASLPHNEDTHHLIEDKEMNLLKKGSIFINVGRGPLINESKIKGNFNHLSALILDVFEMEPLDTDSYLWQTENVILTPHIASNSDFTEEAHIQLVVDNLKRIASNAPLINEIV